MSTEEPHGQPVLNTDRELYREDTGDSAGSYYENSVHVTRSGAIGMNVGGTVLVQPIADWHRDALAARGITGFGPDGPRYTTPADVTREPTGGQGLREAITRGLEKAAHRCQHEPCTTCLVISDEAFDAMIDATAIHDGTPTLIQGKPRAISDAVLALDELAALIADAERVRELEATVARVREEIAWLEAANWRETTTLALPRLSRALDGDQ